MDEYIAKFPPDVQIILEEIRMTIRSEAPEAVETMSYQMPTFTLHENLVHFAAYARHIGFYPSPSAIRAFHDQIAHLKWAKGSVQFPLDKPMPLELIREMVRFRVIEVTAKAEAKKNMKKKKQT